MPTTAPKPFVFVLMPFKDEFNDIYKLGIEAACDDAGAYCERVDQQIFHGSILERVYNQISKADVVVADMSGQNPNVFYEVGYAHALGKAVILATHESKDIPFDLKHFSHIVYDGSIVTLKSELTKRIAWCIDNPTVSLRKLDHSIEVLLMKVELADGCSYECQIVDNAAELHFAVKNVGTTVIEGGQTYLSLEMEDRVRIVQFEGRAEQVTLPNDEVRFNLPPLPRMLPGAWRSQSLFLHDKSRVNFANQSVIPATARLHTELGTRESRILIHFVPAK